MSDPRGNMTFKCQAASIQQQTDARAFGNAVGKIGDLQILNSIGGGAIGQGLRTLASVSNTIRTGAGSLPSSIGSTLNSGANWVLEQTGIAPTVINAVKGFNPQIANQAWGQAQQIYQKVHQGHFKLTDIPGSLQDLQNLERLGRNIFTPGDSQAGRSVSCVTSPYAMDLIARAPKHKFMFVVQFIFQAGYSDLKTNEMAFVVKKSSRPNIRFQTEDVNYYNFHTKVITKTEFEEMSMTFHDDMRNQSIEFYTAYLNAMAPITNLDGNHGLINPEESGMDFTDGINTASLNNGLSSIASNQYTASRGPLLNGLADVKDILVEIRLFHVYDSGRLMNVYHFLNPRISQLQLDELDMSSSEGNEVSLNFNYDSVYLETEVPANESPYADNATSLPGQQSGALYPLRYVGGTSNTTLPIPDVTGSGINPAINPMGLINNAISGTVNTVNNAVANVTSGVASTLKSIGL